MRQPLLARALAAWAVILVAAACQTTGPTVTPLAIGTASPPGTTAPRPTTSPNATGEASPSLSPQGTPTVQPSTGTGEVEIGPGTFFLADPRIGLDTLASYTETLTVSFSGTAEGQASTWSKSYRLQHTAQPAVSVLTIEASGDADAPDPAALAEAAGAAYQSSADGTCSDRPLDAESSILASREPAGQLPGLMGADDAGSDTANGVASSHYTYDGRALL